MLLWFLLLVTSGLLKDTKALSVGETHPSERGERDVSGAIWDYIVVSGFFQCYMSLYLCTFHQRARYWILKIQVMRASGWSHASTINVRKNSVSSYFFF